MGPGMVVVACCRGAGECCCYCCDDGGGDGGDVQLVRSLCWHCCQCHFGAKSCQPTRSNYVTFPYDWFPMFLLMVVINIMLKYVSCMGLSRNSLSLCLLQNMK